MKSRRQVVFAVLASLGVARSRPLGAAGRVGALSGCTATRERLLAATGLMRIDSTPLLQHAPTRRQLEEVANRCGPKWLRLGAVGSQRKLAATLRGWIVADYENGRLTEIDGWQLAESEAMLLAVHAGLLRLS